MRTLLYSFQTAFKDLWREKWINALTVLTISLALLTLSTFVLITLNIDLTLKEWSRGFGLLVHLKDNLSAEDKNLLREYFKKDTDIIEVNYISKEQALKELMQTFKEMSPVFEGIEENPLPSSFELKLKREALQPTHIKEKAEHIKQIPGVEDVQYGERWLSSLSSLSRWMKIIVIILGSIIFTAIAFVTYSTIKILFYRRAEEIETLKLLGASRSFIRLPFLIEGLFIGLLSGIIGFFTIFGLYELATSRIIEFLPSIKGTVTFFPSVLYPVLPFTGAIMSLIGSIFAIGRIRY